MGSITLMNYLASRYFVSTLLFVAFSCAPLSLVLAQESSSATGDSEVTIMPYPTESLPSAEVYRDFVVGPGKFEIELAPGESKIVELVVSNRMGEKKRFSLTAEDMTGSTDPTQAVKLLREEKGPYTLKDYISVPQTEFDLEHGMRARIPVTVSLPPDAEPGGRYGSLLVSIISSSNGEGDTSGAVPGSVVISRIGTLFFVTNPGEVTQELKLVDFTTAGERKVFTKGPINFSLVSENTGSMHTTPYGEVRIFNMLGAEVGFFELEPWFVMPQSLRLREVAWNRELLMGKYTAVAKVNRGYGDIVDEKSITFWVVPVKLLFGLAVVLLSFFVILHFILSRFEFKRKGG